MTFLNYSSLLFLINFLVLTTAIFKGRPGLYTRLFDISPMCPHISFAQAWSHSNANEDIQLLQVKQDGPSLKSSPYLNVTLRYLGLWDPMNFGHLDSWNFGPLGLFPLPPPPYTSSYLHLSLHPTSSYFFLPPPTHSYLLLCPPTSS